MHALYAFAFSFHERVSKAGKRLSTIDDGAREMLPIRARRRDTAEQETASRGAGGIAQIMVLSPTPLPEGMAGAKEQN